MTNKILNDLADEYYEWTLRTNPINASMRGVHDYDSEFGESSREAEDREIGELRDMANRAKAINPDSLSDSEKVTRDVLIFEADTQADALEARLAEMFVNHTMGIQALIPVMVQQMPIETKEHGDSFIERFEKSQQGFGELAGRLEEGVANGRTPMASTVEKSVAQLDAMLQTPIEDDVFLSARLPAGLEASEWRDRLLEVTRNHVRPALQSYRDTIADIVLPASRGEDRPGLCWLPDGEESYSKLIHANTSIDLTADQIHEIGLAQIANLADEYRLVGPDAIRKSQLDEIFTALRDDPDLHFESGPEVVEHSEVAMARAKAEMADWFGRLPQADCVVAEVSSGPAAFYFPPTVDGSRPGTFFVNTADPSRIGRYEIEALAFHEGIPGHHLQLAIALELEDIPEFRKHALITVYAEGWGLYTERLADEMGLYSSPLDRIGMLSADSLRAGRLVVDTGIHAKGWTRKQAIDFFVENSPMSLVTIEAEVDRYIGNPGQALAYMIGRLEIMRMRSEAMDKLSQRFDIKGFHDTVLGSGLVPIPTLQRLIDDWVESADS